MVLTITASDSSGTADFQIMGSADHRLSFSLEFVASLPSVQDICMYIWLRAAGNNSGGNVMVMVMVMMIAMVMVMVMASKAICQVAWLPSYQHDRLYRLKVFSWGKLSVTNSFNQMQDSCENSTPINVWLFEVWL